MTEFLNYINERFLILVLGISLVLILIFISRIDKKDKIILGLIVGATITLSIFEFVETLFDADHVSYHNFPRYLFSALAYIMRPIIIVLFFHIRFNLNRKQKLLVWAGAAVNAVMYTFMLFAYKFEAMRFVVWFSDKNTFVRTNLGYTVHVICAYYLVLLVVTSIIDTNRHHTGRQINFIIFGGAITAVTAQVLSMVLDLKYSNTSDVYVIGAILYYTYLGHDKSKKEAVAQAKMMQEKTTALMLSQIQPHFIYNTLATIQVLCELDPEKASQTIDDFSTYLRMNTDALSKTGPVTLEEEIRHTKAYAKIEMIRFDNVRVEFDIKDNDFKLPVLTVEPLVENAIKYGARERDEGIVTVSTYKEGNYHVLVIKDNGLGFDVNKVKTDGKQHVGVNNVKTRIIKMMNGTFTVESVIGEGTTVTIMIPDVNELESSKAKKRLFK